MDDRTVVAAVLCDAGAVVGAVLADLRGAAHALDQRIDAETGAHEPIFFRIGRGDGNRDRAAAVGFGRAGQRWGGAQLDQRGGEGGGEFAVHGGDPSWIGELLLLGLYAAGRLNRSGTLRLAAVHRRERRQGRRAPVRPGALYLHAIAVGDPPRLSQPTLRPLATSSSFAL